MLWFAAYTSGNVFRQQVVPAKAHVELLWNRVSFCELTFDDDDKAFTDVAAGCRVSVLWGDSPGSSVQLFRGPVVKLESSSEDRSTVVTVEADFRLFNNLAWPKPSAAITAQTDVSKRYSGPTETVIKSACTDLSSRLGFGWTVPTTAGLGSTQRVDVRFDRMLDKLGPLAEQDRLTWDLQGTTVMVTQGATFPHTLTVDSGVIEKYTWSMTAPAMTRVVVGGDGSGSSKVFRAYADSTAESLWGFIAEGYTDSSLASGVTDLSPDANAVLAENSARVAVSAELLENAVFKFGTYHLGDIVHVVIGQIDTTEVIRKIVIDDDRDKGLLVSPSIGDIDSDADSKLGRQVATLARTMRAQGRRF